MGPEVGAEAGAGAGGWGLVEVEGVAHLVGGDVALEAAEDLQAEGDGVAGGAAGDDPAGSGGNAGVGGSAGSRDSAGAGADGGGGGEDGALRDGRILAAVEAGELDAGEDLRPELAQDEARRGALADLNFDVLKKYLGEGKGHGPGR